jgi:integrase
VKWGRAKRNVADITDPPAAAAARADAERSRRTWTPEQLGAFLEHVRSHRLGAAFHLAATTGMRRGEVLGAAWSDLDLEGARLTIRRTVVAPNRRVKFSSPKTSAGLRTVALDAGTVETLRAHRKRQAEERLRFGRGYDGNDLVFCEPDGSPIQPNSFSKTFDRLVVTSGLPRIRLHDLRHTHASIGLAAGVHAKTMSDRLGHSTIAITMDIYSHSMPATDAAAAELIAAQVQASVARPD